MSGGRARLAPPPKHCEQCSARLPEQLGAGRPRRKCLKCSPPVKGTSQTRARRSRPVLIELAETLEGFGVRGQAMWDEWADRMPSPGATALLREGCRLADRAERMHRLIEGQASAFAVLGIDEVLEEVFGRAVEHDVAEIHINLNISSVTIEARNTATALRSIVAELRTAVKQAGAEQEGDDDPIAAIAASMAGRAPSGGNVVQMRKR